MERNEVKAKVERGAVVFGTYLQIPSPSMVEACALAGLDFVRLDPYHVAFGRETVQAMIGVLQVETDVHLDVRAVADAA